MAKCAKKIILSNGFADKIKIIPKRSTEVTVGSGDTIYLISNLNKVKTGDQYLEV
jgi:hypothetical protein